MQAGQQVAGVVRVPADGGVGPAGVAVAVEPHVQLHQAGHRLDRVVVELQGAQPLADELGAHGLVVPEGDGPALLEAARGRLADVVQQRRQAQHGVGGRRRVLALQLDGLLQHRQGVGVDVLVAVVLVRLELQGRQLGQDVVGQAGAHEQVEPGARVRSADELDELLADAFGGDDRDPLGHCGHGLLHLGGHGEAELRGEAGGAHHAQRVIGEGVLGGAGGAQHAGVQVPHAAEGVHELEGGQAQGHGVDGEVAAQQVVLEAVAEGHLRLAAGRVVLLGPIGGDLELPAGLAEADGPEPPPHVPRGVRPAGAGGLGRVRAGIRGEVQVQRRPPQEEVADRAAHQGELVAGGLEPPPQLHDDGGQGGVRGEAGGQRVGGGGQIHDAYKGARRSRHGPARAGLELTA
ncbi:hypothetical protein GY12_03525 [Micrococcus luteus]|nr:hypothetical protein GY12_03525 [Micrococcus luteus]